MTRFLVILLGISAVLWVAGCQDTTPTADEADTPAANPAASAQEQATPSAAAQTEQTTCPVMGGPINKEYFTVYEGKKVYFCCPGCDAEFAKNPEKYVEDLPQFN